MVSTFPPIIQEYLWLRNPKLKSELEALKKARDLVQFDKKDLILMRKQEEHWERLASVAGILTSNLSRGSKVSLSDGSTIRFPVDEELEQGLLKHLQNEFPEFAKIDRWQDPATLRFVKINKEAFQILKRISRRGTFVGKCSICELWK